MPEIINNLIDYLNFIFERLDWLSVVDILLVTSIFFVLFLLVRDTQAIVLVRGGFILLLLLGLLTSLEVLPAFSWLVGNSWSGQGYPGSKRSFLNSRSVQREVRQQGPSTTGCPPL